jgi:hypothetical protein
MKRPKIALLLLLLVFWAQIDDPSAAWLSGQSSTIPTDDDEYCVTVRNDCRSRSSTRDEFTDPDLMSASFTPQESPATPFSRFESQRFVPLGPDPLYVLMSLQC